MAFRRSPVRSRSGPPTSAHDCRRRLPAIAPKARRRPDPPPNELRLASHPSPPDRSRKLPRSKVATDAVRATWHDELQELIGIFGPRIRRGACSLRCMPTKRIVYILRNGSAGCRPYVGLTHDIRHAWPTTTRAGARTPRATARGNFTSPSNSPTSNEPSRSSATSSPAPDAPSRSATLVEP